MSKVRINQETFEDWRESEVTEVFFNYLRDIRKYNCDDMRELIEAGAILSDQDQIRYFVENETLLRVEDTTFELLEEFYSNENTRRQGAD